MGVHRDSETYNKVKQLLDIPEDEPIFIIRAQDRFSVKTIQSYRKMVRDGSKIGAEKLFSWYEDVGSVISDFINWQRDNRDKVKVPD
jgi:hypothetical protein